ncbi:MAG: hypothetical protein M1832_001038 [Thelocarpon impressellum]|nr:MAG: hypothetical protein M1832_001038 [Thelocarpon impressellum]
MADTATAPAEGDKRPKIEKPERPDETQYREELSKAEKEHASVMEKLNAVKAKLDLARPPANGSPVQKRQQQLRAQLTSLREQRQGLKSSKGNIQEKIRQLDTTLKSRIAEQKTARSRLQYKNVEEVDREIQRLEKQVETGMMKIVDEKKALADVSSLKKQRKGFAGFEEAEKGIDNIKAQLGELRKGLDDPESKALNEKFSAITKELDEIKAEQDEAYKGINSLRDERTKLQGEQQEKYSGMRAIKDRYYSKKKAYADYENEAYRVKREKQRAEKEAYDKDRRRKVAEKKLEEANEPAYMDEILTAEGLIRYFDPSAASASTKESSPGKFAAQASRTVGDGDLKGTKVVKKDEEDYFMGTGGKKGKKGKANRGSPAAAPAFSEKFSLSVGVIEELGKVNVEPPMGPTEVPTVVEKLKGKLAHWKEDQARQTKANVEKARKEIDKLEAEAADPAPQQSGSGGRKAKDGAGKKTAEVNGEGAPAAPAGEAERALEKDGAADAAKELEAASLEDKQK